MAHSCYNGIEGSKCFQRFLLGIARKLGFFVVREHAGLDYEVLSELRKRGRGETGEVLEQRVVIGDEGGSKPRLRRVVVRLDEATQDGDWELVIVTNLPATKVSAEVVSSAYRKRRTIEGGFLDLTTTPDCEIDTLC